MYSKLKIYFLFSLSYYFGIMNALHTKVKLVFNGLGW